MLVALMNGRLILAEHATAHPDGTISMLRAGINQIHGPALPVPFQGTLVVRVVADIADQGEHVVDLRCMNQDGKLALPVVQGGIAIPAGGGAVNLLFGLQVAFQEKGKLIWYLRVDQHVVDELPIMIRVGPSDPGTGSQG